MTSALHPRAEPAPARVLHGVTLVAAGYFFFSLQDVIVKSLVATLPVWQVLFFRSVVIMGLAAAVTRGEGIRRARASQRKLALAGRAVVILLSWLSYYTASRVLGLAEMVTLYFAAPIFVLVLSIPILGERPSLARWLAVLVGFGGVVLAADPTGEFKLVPAAMVVFAAFGWALTTILVRVIARSETTTTQMVASNFLFAVACVPVLATAWVTPVGWQWALLLGLGIVGGIGQYLVYEGFCHAPASALAPIEYTSLIWAFLFGWLVWNDVPKTVVFAGAGLIALSGAGIIIVEGRGQWPRAKSRTGSR
jgi:S-adenosylmethionine uptake transporter